MSNKILIGRCKNCKHWKTFPYQKGMKGNCFHKEHQHIHPEYYLDAEGDITIDGIETTYTPSFGPEYGCVHFKDK